MIACSISQAASTNDLPSLVQRGLFEEEANHNLDAAMKAYESAISLNDKNRQLAATAIFRLGECYRKQGKTNDANEQYKRIVTQFSDQKELVDLSRNYLGDANAAALPNETIQPGDNLDVTIKERTDLSKTYEVRRGGYIIMLGFGQIPVAGKTVAQAKQAIQDAISEVLYLKHAHIDVGRVPWRSTQSVGSDTGVSQLETAQAEALANQVKGLSGDDLINFFTTVQPDSMMVDLEQKRQKAILELKKAGGSFNPLYKSRKQEVDAIADQLSQRAKTLAWSIEEKYKLIKDEETALKPRRQRFGEAAATLNADQTTTSAEDEEIRKIKEMIRNSPDLIDAPIDGDVSIGTPLQKAASYGHVKVAEFLLASGANINATTSKVPPPLLCAAKYGHNAMVELLLQKGADANQRGDFVGGRKDVTALDVAAINGFKTVAETLLAHGADVNLRAKEGRMTALHWAVSRENPAMVELLLNHHADVNATNSAGMTPLHFAKAQIVPLLLKAGAAVNAKSNDGYTPLITAASGGDVDKVKLLLDNGATVEDQVSEKSSNTQQRGFRPLNFAVYNDNPKMLSLLLEHHADSNSKITWEKYEVNGPARYVSIPGTTPLIMAADRIAVDVAGILLDNHADANLADENGRTPLHHVVSAAVLPGWPYQGSVQRQNEAPAFVKLLIAHGADVNAKYKTGSKPLDYIRDVQQTPTINEIRDLLVKAGAKGTSAPQHEGNVASPEVPQRGVIGK